MSQIVKTTETTGGFGIEVPVCAGIAEGTPTASNMIDGQIVIGAENEHSPNEKKSLYVGKTGTSPNEKPEQVNAIFPLIAVNASFSKVGSTGSSYIARGNTNGNQKGFQVRDGVLESSSVDNAKIKNFTAESVKVILESGSYGDYQKMLSISPQEGQIFFLITEPQQQDGEA